MVDSLGSVLIVDDEPSTRAYVSRLLSKEGIVVEEASTAQAARERLCAKNGISLLLIDINLDGSDMTGPALAEWVYREQPKVSVILLTGDEDAEIEGKYPLLFKDEISGGNHRRFVEFIWARLQFLRAEKMRTSQGEMLSAQATATDKILKCVEELPVKMEAKIDRKLEDFSQNHTLPNLVRKWWNGRDYLMVAACGVLVTTVWGLLKLIHDDYTKKLEPVRDVEPLKYEVRQVRNDVTALQQEALRTRASQEKANEMLQRIWSRMRQSPPSMRSSRWVTSSGGISFEPRDP